jgi:hypothetical protein
MVKCESCGAEMRLRTIVENGKSKYIPIDKTDDEFGIGYFVAAMSGKAIPGKDTWYVCTNPQCGNIVLSW